MPFGEFIPLRPVLGWIVERARDPAAGFLARRARSSSRSQSPGSASRSNICYEDAFGEEIIRQLPEATLLVNVSNVAWFGRSIAPQQHLQISQARALETGRYMLRATNTGMTAIIDERGRVVQAAPQFDDRGRQRRRCRATPARRLTCAGATTSSSRCALLLHRSLAALRRLPA